MRCWAWLCAVCAALLLLRPIEARACGALSSASAKRVPSLKVEKALIVHDSAKGLEHFVREVAFQDAKTTFGFVVPVPTKPEVASMADPFEPLENLVTGRPLHVRRPTGIPKAAAGGGSLGVTVIEQKPVGSFAATVLAANDAAGLKRWIAGQGLAVPPEMAAWLTHYVDLGFYYVVFRYNPEAKQAGALRSETVRISFSTPVPYFPYLEPAWEASRAPLPGLPERVLALWLISDERHVPVALHRTAQGSEWARPWLERYPGDDRSRLLALEVAGTTPIDRTAYRRLALSAPPPGKSELYVASAQGFTPELRALLPSNPRAQSLNVQYFQDQKVKRSGFGDVLLAPERPAQALALDKLPAALQKAFTTLLEPKPVPAAPALSELLGGRADWDRLPLFIADSGDRFDDQRYERLSIQRPKLMTQMRMLSFSSVSVSGGTLPDLTYQARILGAPFGRCYAVHRQVEGKLADGSIDLVLQVGNDGRVASAEGKTKGRIPPDLVSCMLDRAKVSTFAPPQGGPASVVLSLAVEGD